MYVVLKNNYGHAVALFLVERETPKRFYGRLYDTVIDDKWFYLTGLTRGHQRNVDHCTKEIVMCTMKSDHAWMAMKPDLARILLDYQSRARLIAAEDGRMRERTREKQEDNRKRAMYDGQEELEKYVAAADMFHV